MQKELIIEGFDAHGNIIVETVPAPLPSLYFWLGKDAYQEWKEITLDFSLIDKPDSDDS